MGLKYALVQKHPTEMAPAELAAIFGDMPDAQVMRSLLVAEVEAIRKGGERELRTMRGLWYNVIKPCLSRMGRLNEMTRGGKPKPWDRTLSRVLAELVRIGYTTYEELRIIDGSRQRQPATVVNKTIFDVDLVGDHFPWVIIFTEKDTIWPVVQDVAELYGVSAISGGGEPSYACTENTVRAIVRSDAYQQRSRPSSGGGGEEGASFIAVLSLTDYDPWGYTIANAQFTQVQEAVEGIRGEAGDVEVYHERLGLLPGQLTPEERAENAYEPKDSGLAEWLIETGGVDGQPLGLELDALPLSRIQRMFAEGIGPLVDLDRRRDDLRQAFVSLIACDLLLPEFERKHELLTGAIKNSPPWQTILNTIIPDGLFRRAAELGLNCIDPKATKLFDCEAEVREVMNRTLDEGNGQ